MKRGLLLLIALLFLNHGDGVEGASFMFTTQDDSSLSAKFNPQPKGWLGADVSASLSLTDNTYLWLWGDTVYGNLATKGSSQYRNLSAFPHSSIAFVNMSTPTQLPSFWVRQLPHSASIDPMGVFTPQNPSNPKEFYWIPIGIMTPTTKNLVVLAQVIVSSNTGLGFDQLGSDVVLVENPFQGPESWTYTTSRIPSSNANLTWNSGIAFNEGYFYLIGLYNSNAYLARITEADLVKFNWAGMTFWSKGSAWATSTSQMLSIYPSTCTEGTLQYHSYMQRWFVILAQAFEGSISIAHAEQITGPYTVQTIYNYPKQYQNGTYFAYAGKSHPEYAADNEIVFTYNVNANSLTLLFEDLDIYHPKFVRATITKH